MDDQSITVSNEIEMEKIPIKALREKTRLILSKLLNSIKILSSNEGLPRDWRGIAYLAGLQSLHGPTITMQLDPMSKVLQLWTDTNDQNETGSFRHLIDFLGAIDRWDVIDDIKESLDEDAKFYLTTKQQTYRSINKVPDESIVQIDSDINILTKDDVLRSKEGLPPQQYDGFVLFVDEDIDFATELIERMENFGLKLCIKDRDLIGGITFELEAIMRLIAERCNRLIVIVSTAFFESSANTFFVNFAQALGIEQRRRKIIPCLYQHCILPRTLSIYFILNYQRSGRFWDFWEKLRDSIQNTSIEVATIQTGAITAPPSISNNINTNETVNINNINNDAYPSTTLPIKIPRKKHSIQNIDDMKSSLTISDSVPVNLSITNNDDIQVNSIHNSHSMIELSSKNSMNMKNNCVELSSDSEKSSTTKWYKKLLLNKLLTSDNQKDENKKIVQKGPKAKKQWFKKKLISS